MGIYTFIKNNKNSKNLKLYYITSFLKNQKSYVFFSNIKNIIFILIIFFFPNIKNNFLINKTKQYIIIVKNYILPKLLAFSNLTILQWGYFTIICFFITINITSIIALYCNYYDIKIFNILEMTLQEAAKILTLKLFILVIIIEIISSYLLYKFNKKIFNFYINYEILSYKFDIVFLLCCPVFGFWYALISIGLEDKSEFIFLFMFFFISIFGTLTCWLCCHFWAKYIFKTSKTEFKYSFFLL
jgi:hypothetical protein